MRTKTAIYNDRIISHSINKMNSFICVFNPITTMMKLLTFSHAASGNLRQPLAQACTLGVLTACRLMTSFYSASFYVRLTRLALSLVYLHTIG